MAIFYKGSSNKYSIKNRLLKLKRWQTWSIGWIFDDVQILSSCFIFSIQTFRWKKIFQDFNWKITLRPKP